MAFYSWVKGYFDPKWKETFENMGPRDMETIDTAGIRVQRRTLPDYSTDDFWEAHSMWRDWKRFGFPCAGGSLDQPALWLDVVRAMQSHADKMKVE